MERETKLIRTTMWVGVLQQLIKYGAIVLIVYLLWLMALDLTRHFVVPTVYLDGNKQECVVVGQKLYCRLIYAPQ